MDAVQIRHDLESIRLSADFAAESSSLADRWSAAGAGLEVVAPILQFMESHPDLEYGMPGGLVHFVERFHRRGYEELLVNSVLRRPTLITTWMLNRLINGTQDLALRHRYVDALKQAATHPGVDPDTTEQVERFLNRL